VRACARAVSRGIVNAANAARLRSQSSAPAPLSPTTSSGPATGKAATGRPDRTTVAVLGDGGALMGLPDLETLVRVARSALVVIFNDAAYGAEVHMYSPLIADISPATFGDTDFAAVARSLGAQAATVRTVADLAGLRAWLEAGCRGTYLLDCKVVPDVVARYLSDLGGHIRAGGGARR